MQTVEKETDANMILIPIDGPKQYWRRDNELPLEEAYKLAGIDPGYIQLVEVEVGEKKAQMLIHEEGKLRGLDFNERATELYSESQDMRASVIGGDYIVGPALLLLDEAKWT